MSWKIDTKLELPLYQKEFYAKLYNNQNLCAFLDKDWVQKLLTLGAYEDMVDSVQREVSRGQRVLQIGLTRGSQIYSIADRIGKNGQYDIIDVNPVQLQLAKEKYQDYPMLNLIHQEAVSPYENDYDIVICFQLLHEVPLPEKIKIIDQALAALCWNGKAVFVDYHRPVWYHPLRYFIRMFNRLYQPFSEKMWDNEIYAMSSNSSEYNWRKTTFCGRMYQKVVATRKGKKTI